MQIYKVGGCVRDMLMGVEPKDIDYVVVGSNVDEMLQSGYKMGGISFPVFRDENGDEYALARKETKTGAGYVGFEFDIDDVSLSDDLFRRDLTCNSIAMDSAGNIVDPFGGQQDIDDKILRHTSDAFLEDPVRVLRVARFMARFGDSWKIAPETKRMISRMGKKGVLHELQPDRVWKEMSRAIAEPHPHLFFETLYQCDVLHFIFPEIYRLVSATESLQWHPEGNAFAHTMLVIKQAAINKFSPLDVFCALVHDIGKGLTPIEKLPTHYGHDVNGAKFVGEFCDKYHVPNEYRGIAKFVTRYHMYMHKLNSLNPSTYVKMFDGCGGKYEYVVALYNLGICDERGRLGSENVDISGHADVYKYFEAYKSVRFADIEKLQGVTDGEKIKNTIFAERVKAVGRVKKSG